MQSSNLCFAKTQRLLKAGEFRTVFDHPSKKIHSEHFLLFVAQQDSQCRLGLAITKKKLRCATDRNYVKRQAREIFRLSQYHLPCVDCVLIIKKNPFLDNTKKQVIKIALRAELFEIFNKLTQLSHLS